MWQFDLRPGAGDAFHAYKSLLAGHLSLIFFPSSTGPGDSKSICRNGLLHWDCFLSDRGAIDNCRQLSNTSGCLLLNFNWRLKCMFWFGLPLAFSLADSLSLESAIQCVIHLPTRRGSMEVCMAQLLLESSAALQEISVDQRMAPLIEQYQIEGDFSRVEALTD